MLSTSVSIGFRPRKSVTSMSRTSSICTCAGLLRLLTLGTTLRSIPARLASLLNSRTISVDALGIAMIAVRALYILATLGNSRVPATTGTPLSRRWRL